MQKTIKLTLLFILMVIFTNLSFGATPSTGISEVTLISQIPDPVEPGEYVDLRFKIDNIGTATINSMKFEVVTSYPFSFDNPSDAIVSGGNLYSIQKADNGIVVFYKVRVDKLAVTGNNKLKFRFYYNDVWSQYSEFDIRVQSRLSNLVVEEVSTVPELISPGDNFKIKFLLTNLASDDFKNVKVKIDFNNLGFTPKDSVNEKVIPLILKGKSSELLFDIIADSDSKIMNYKIPILIEYETSTGVKYYKNVTTGIILTAKPEIMMTLGSQDVYLPGQIGKVSLKFVNRGLSDIKFLTVTLNDSSNYEIISASESYIGKLDSDDYESSEFNIFIKKDAPLDILLPVTVQFRDSQNKEYVLSKNFELKLYSDDDAKRLGLVAPNQTIGIVIVIVILVLGLILYRVIKGRKGQV